MWLSVVAALRLAVPGADPRAWTRWWPLVLLGAAIAVDGGGSSRVMSLAGDGRPARCRPGRCV